MRSLFIALLFCLTAPLYSASAKAYVIHNNTGFSGYPFKGGDCPACFEGRIEDGDTAACPGNEKGCRGETTIYIAKKQDYFGWCKLTAPTKVTAHGDVYAYKNHVVVKNDVGMELYNGPWKIEMTCASGRDGKPFWPE